MMINIPPKIKGGLKAMSIGVTTAFIGGVIFASSSYSAEYVCQNTPAQYEDAKQFVDCNTKLVLSALNDESLTPEQRTEKFDSYMDEFANIPAIGKFSLGSYAKKLKNDPETMSRFLEAFRLNMLTVYQTQLDSLRGDTIEVTKVNERRKGKDAIVETLLTRDGKEVALAAWRIINVTNPKSPKQGWQVVDVSLDFGGQPVWLGIEVKEFHKLKLNESYGDFNALIDVINTHTAKLQAEMAAQN